MRRALLALAGVVLVLAVVAGAILVLQSRDAAQVTGRTGPGEKVAGRCPGGTASIAHDAGALSREQLDGALAAGDVVLAYGPARPPKGLKALQHELAGPFDSELAAAGQAVVLARLPGTRGVLALAWQRRLQAAGARDRQLRAFTDAWLGHGAPKPCRNAA